MGNLFHRAGSDAEEDLYRLSAKTGFATRFKRQPPNTSASALWSGRWSSVSAPERRRKHLLTLRRTILRNLSEFAEKWLPIHARKERFSPNSYDSYRSNLDRHVLPYFGDQVMSSITAEDIDDFLDALSRKPCRGPKSYGKRRRIFRRCPQVP